LGQLAVVRDALACLEDLNWIRSETVRARVGGRPGVRFHLNPGVTRERA
jgi:hypothetical protein